MAYQPVVTYLQRIARGCLVRKRIRRHKIDATWCSVMTDKIVQDAISHTVDVNIRTGSGFTPLMHAARYPNNEGSSLTVRLLLENNANVNHQDNDGMTALMYAALNSHTISTVNIVTLLLEYNADVTHQDNDGWTALMYAVFDFPHTTSNKNIVTLLLKNSADVNHQNVRGQTALIIASAVQNCTLWSENIVTLLLEYNADVNHQDKDGMTALMYATKCSRTRNSHTTSTINIVTLLLDKGANIHARNDRRLNAYELYTLNHKPCDDTIAIAKLLKPRRMRINITKTVSFYDPITQELKDINIGKYIEETADNVVFVYRSNEYFFTQRSIIKKELNKTSETAYNLTKIGLVNTFPYCDLTRFFSSDSQLFGIVGTTNDSYATVAVSSCEDNPEETISRHKRRRNHFQGEIPLSVFL